MGQKLKIKEKGWSGVKIVILEILLDFDSRPNSVSLFFIYIITGSIESSSAEIQMEVQ